MFQILAFGDILRKPALADDGVLECWSDGGMEGNRGIPLLHYSIPPALRCALCLVAETLLMATLLHALAALVLGNFRLASFFERAHSGFSDCEPGFNHLIRRVATYFFAGASSAHAKRTNEIQISHRLVGASVAKIENCFMKLSVDFTAASGWLQ